MPEPVQLSRFQDAIRRIDEANAQDPHLESADGQTRPRELLYAERLTGWVLALQPAASEALLLAARSQHIRRWMIPRDSYPLDRAGYLRWRNDLKNWHAEETARILTACGYDETMVTRVRSLNLKKDLARDPEMQVLEDALCLVFLQFQLSELAAKTEKSKVVSAIRKSWLKMSQQGHAAALGLDYPPEMRALLEEAVKPQEDR